MLSFLSHHFSIFPFPILLPLLSLVLLCFLSLIFALSLSLGPDPTLHFFVSASDRAPSATYGNDFENYTLNLARLGLEAETADYN